jgi:regulatory factor X 1/2/3
MCQHDYGMIQQLETNFKVMLQLQNSLEEWAAWLKGVVLQVVKPHEGKSNFAKTARQFLFKWPFYR